MRQINNVTNACMHMAAVGVGILLSLLLYYYIYHLRQEIEKKKTRVHCVLTTRNAFHKTKGAYMPMQRIQRRENKKPTKRTKKNKIRIRRHKENLQLAACVAL